MTISTLALIALTFNPLSMSVEDMTLAEFQTYLEEKMSHLPEAAVSRIAGLVDKDGDGSVSETEFAGRMAVIQAELRSGGGPGSAAPRRRDRPAVVPMFDYLQRAPKTLPALTKGAPATVLVITGSNIADAWLPYARWKTAQGRPTAIVTVEEIARASEEGGIQEKIRRFVRDHIENKGTRWVVLGGDSEPGGGVVPGGPTTVHQMEPDGIPTDIVYLSKSNWDADGDGILGEWKDDRESITYPDGTVGLGRVPVRSADDVAAFTAKVIAYESAYPTGGFAEEMLFTSADERSSLKVIRSWDDHIGAAWDGTAKRLFANQSSWDGEGGAGSFELSPTNLVARINAAEAGKMHIHGHGKLDRWILETGMFKTASVGALKNKGAYPIITTVSCNTGEYDSKRDPSIVESMIRQPEAGSVAIVAPIRTGKMHFHSDKDFDLMLSEGKLDGSTRLLAEYWVAALKGKLSTGHALASAVRGLTTDAAKSHKFHLCLCEFNLLGDPTLPVHAKAPRAPSLEVKGDLKVGPSTVEILTDAPGATVCVWKGLEVYEVATLDADGVATLTIAPATVGALVVTIRGPGLNVTGTEVQVR